MWNASCRSRYRCAHAGDARRARQATSVDRQPPGVTGGDDEAVAGHRTGGAGRHTGCGAARAAVSARGAVIERAGAAGDDEQRPIRPPRSELRMNLQPQRPRPAQARRPTEPLERDQRRLPGERVVQGVSDPARGQRAGGERRDDARRETIERMGRTVRGLGRALEPLEERAPARADDHGGRCARQQRREPQPRRHLRAGGVEVIRRQGQANVQSPVVELNRQPGERFVVGEARVARVRRAPT
jgi:hypothetical protein